MKGPAISFVYTGAGLSKPLARSSGNLFVLSAPSIYVIPLYGWRISSPPRDSLPREVFSFPYLPPDYVVPIDIRVRGRQISREVKKRGMGWDGARGVSI